MNERRLVKVTVLSEVLPRSAVQVGSRRLRGWLLSVPIRQLILSELFRHRSFCYCYELALASPSPCTLRVVAFPLRVLVRDLLILAIVHDVNG